MIDTINVSRVHKKRKITTKQSEIKVEVFDLCGKQKSDEDSNKKECV